MIKFLIDSSSDCIPEELCSNDIIFIPLSVAIDNKTYLDGIDISKTEFYELLKNSEEFPKTSMPSPEAFIPHFENARNNGDSIICLLISSNLSGTYQSAVLAKNIVDYDGIFVIDTQNVASSIKILLEYCLNLRNSGISAEEIVAKSENIKERIKVFAVLDTLEYLYRGGRLSRSSATLGNIAKIKPTVTVKDGKVTVIKKSLGYNKAKNELIDYLKGQNIDYSHPVYTLYTSGTDNCEKFESELLNSNINFTSRVQIGSTIGAHVGAGAFGIFYVEKEL